MSEIKEDPIHKAHTQVAKSLQHATSFLKNIRDDKLEEIRAIDKNLKSIREAVSKGHWWELENYLEEEEIELLCEVEPVPRNSLLDEPWE